MIRYYRPAKESRYFGNASAYEKIVYKLDGFFVHYHVLPSSNFLFSSYRPCDMFSFVERGYLIEISGEDYGKLVQKD